MWFGRRDEGCAARKDWQQVPEFFRGKENVPVVNRPRWNTWCELRFWRDVLVKGSTYQDNSTLRIRNNKTWGDGAVTRGKMESKERRITSQAAAKTGRGKSFQGPKIFEHCDITYLLLMMLLFKLLLINWTTPLPWTSVNVCYTHSLGM